MNDARQKEIYRLLQQKGFGLPQIHCAEHLVIDEINDKYFKDGIEVCENCALGCATGSCKVQGTGPITSPLMIVGDSSSDDDEETGIPLSGPEGYILTMALQVLDIDRRAIYITNTIKCKAMKSPSPDEIATCKPYLEYEIERVKPQVIIALGNAATRALVNHFEVNISKVRGGCFQKDGIYIYPTWHPEYLLMQSGLGYIKARDEFMFDIKNAVDHVKNQNKNYRWKL